MPLPVLNQKSYWEKKAPDVHDTLFSDVIRNYDGGSADGIDVALIGAPFDSAIRGRPGARFAPAELRTELAGMKSHCFETGPVDLNVVDLGDLALSGLTVDQAHEIVEKNQREVLKSGVIPITLGGDHSLSYPLCKPFIEQGSTAVINFDAHLDLREVSKQPSSGTPFNRLFQAGLAGYFVIGCRDYDNSTYYYRKAQELGARIVPATRVSLQRMIEIAEEALSHCRSVADSVYLSVDIDVLDQSEAPGVSAPTPAGLTVREVMVAVRHLCRHPIVKGIDIVEVSPPLDNSGMTAKAGAMIIASMLAGICAR